MAKLVAIGDSLTQGSRSLATTNVELSYPKLVAEALGLNASQFRVPDFSGRGGLPFNLEWMARKLEAEQGGDISLIDWPVSGIEIAKLLDRVEEYWERGPGAAPAADELYHNLAVWNFEVSDAYTTTAARCDERIGKPVDNWFKPPSHGRLRIARRVLNPAQTDARAGDTQIDAARKLAAAEDGIEHLIVWFGSNNCLRCVLELEVRETGAESPGPGSSYTLWSAAAFEEEYRRLAEGVTEIGADHVYVGTVPHVTLLPLLRGISREEGRGRRTAGLHHEHYTWMWIDPADFDPDRDPHLTGEQIALLDERIDAYNRIIRQVAGERGWQVVDVSSVIDRMAGRDGIDRVQGLLPEPIADLDMRYLEVDPSGRLKQGGLISLDGMHPTSCGYAMCAQAFIDAIREHEPAISDIDFAHVRRWDSLVSDPPRTLDDVAAMLRAVEGLLHISRWLLVSDAHGVVLRR